VLTDALISQSLRRSKHGGKLDEHAAPSPRGGRQRNHQRRQAGARPEQSGGAEQRKGD
jgi:hypothetical protein